MLNNGRDARHPFGPERVYGLELFCSRDRVALQESERAAGPELADLKTIRADHIGYARISARCLRIDAEEEGLARLRTLQGAREDRLGIEPAC